MPLLRDMLWHDMSMHDSFFSCESAMLFCAIKSALNLGSHWPISWCQKSYYLQLQSSLLAASRRPKSSHSASSQRSKHKGVLQNKWHGSSALVDCCLVLFYVLDLDLLDFYCKKGKMVSSMKEVEIGIKHWTLWIAVFTWITLLLVMGVTGACCKNLWISHLKYIMIMTNIKERKPTILLTLAGTVVTFSAPLDVAFCGLALKKQKIQHSGRERAHRFASLWLLPQVFQLNVTRTVAIITL